MEILDGDQEYQELVWETGENFEEDETPHLDPETEKRVKALQHRIRSTQTQLMDVGKPDIKEEQLYHIFQANGLTVTARDLTEEPGEDKDPLLLEIWQAGKNGFKYKFFKDQIVKTLPKQNKPSQPKDYEDLTDEEFREIDSKFGDINLLTHGIEI